MQEAASTKNPPLLYSICADADTHWLSQWEMHLALLQRNQQIALRSILHIMPGTALAKALEAWLEQADYIVLILSAAFFADEDCLAQMHQALQRSQAGAATLIPLLARPVAWKESPLADLTPLPSNGKALALWQHHDEGLDVCVSELQRLLRQPRTPASAPPAPLPWSDPAAPDRLHCPQCASPDLTLKRSGQGYAGYWCDSHQGWIECPRCGSTQLASSKEFAHIQNEQARLICLNCGYGQSQ